MENGEFGVTTISVISITLKEPNTLTSARPVKMDLVVLILDFELDSDRNSIH